MIDNEVLGIIKETWPIIIKSYQIYKKNYPSLIFHDDKQEQFSKLFQKSYYDVIQKFMTEETKTLDAHKQAALLTICFLQLNIIEHPLENTNEISIIPQMIALDISFTYMLKCLNDSLQKHGIKKKVERYYMPVATACDTPYPEIICRILYYEQNDADMGFNILELSDRYFLIEYINLLQHGIEPHLLK